MTTATRQAIAAAGLRRIRQARTPAWGPGDAATWEAAGGRFRLRHVRRAWGLKLDRPVWHVLQLHQPASPELAPWFSLVGRHFSLTAALRTLRAAQRGAR